MLVLLCGGPVLRIIKQSPMGNGLEAWRRLHVRFEPTVRGRKLSLLASIMKPDFKGCRGVALLDRLNAWRQDVNKYEAAGETLSDAIKIAVVTQALPQELQRHTVLHLNTVPDAELRFDEFERVIEDYVLARKAWTPGINGACEGFSPR